MAGNVKVSVDGNILRMEVDLTCDLGFSSTGRTRLVASDSVRVPGFDGFRASVNVFKKPTPAAAPTA